MKNILCSVQIVEQQKKKKKRKEETLKYQYLSDSPIFILFIYSLLETYLFANNVENMFNDKW